MPCLNLLLDYNNLLLDYNNLLLDYNNLLPDYNNHIIIYYYYNPRININPSCPVLHNTASYAGYSQNELVTITKMWGNKIDNWLIGEINDNFMHSCPLVFCIQVSAWQISLLLSSLQGDMEAAKKRSYIIRKGVCF